MHIIASQTGLSGLSRTNSKKEHEVGRVMCCKRFEESRSRKTKGRYDYILLYKCMKFSKKFRRQWNILYKNWLYDDIENKV